jgi:hypothetical protein
VPTVLRLGLPAKASAGEVYRFGQVVSFPKILIGHFGFESRRQKQRTRHDQTNHLGSS